MQEVGSLLSAWEPAPLPWLGCLVFALVYVAAARSVTARTPTQPWPASQTVCWLAGTFIVWVSLVGPPGAWDDVYFYAHMTQHILLTSLAAPLLVLGDPILLLARFGRPDWRRRRLVPVLRSDTLRFLTHPVTGWVVFVGVMGLSHIPAVYDFALDHPAVHDYVEHPLYLAAGMLYFYPLLVATAGRQVRHWVRIVSLFTSMVFMAFLGFFIFALPSVAYPFYAHTDRPFSPGPLADQHAAGILMWSGSMVVSVVWLVVAGHNWLMAEERRTAREAVRAAAGTEPAV
ncbi:MAG: cytochrome c oxidase assembly protein [Nocardioides sp.]|nr:cytochrome c oxidase assembly protein [Nocardioides sp.]